MLLHIASLRLQYSTASFFSTRILLHHKSTPNPNLGHSAVQENCFESTQLATVDVATLHASRLLSKVSTGWCPHVAIRSIHWGGLTEGGWLYVRSSTLVLLFSIDDNTLLPLTCRMQRKTSLDPSFQWQALFWTCFPRPVRRLQLSKLISKGKRAMSGQEQSQCLQR